MKRNETNEYKKENSFSTGMDQHPIVWWIIFLIFKYKKENMNYPCN
jgi:hypothetical protein